MLIIWWTSLLQKIQVVMPNPLLNNNITTRIRKKYIRKNADSRRQQRLEYLTIVWIFSFKIQLKLLLQVVKQKVVFFQDVSHGDYFYVTAILIKLWLPDPLCPYPRVILCKHTCVWLALLNRILNVPQFYAGCSKWKSKLMKI